MAPSSSLLERRRQMNLDASSLNIKVTRREKAQAIQLKPSELQPQPASTRASSADTKCGSTGHNTPSLKSDGSGRSPSRHSSRQQTLTRERSCDSPKSPKSPTHSVAGIAFATCAAPVVRAFIGNVATSSSSMLKTELQTQKPVSYEHGVKNFKSLLPRATRVSRPQTVAAPGRTLQATRAGQIALGGVLAGVAVAAVRAGGVRIAQKRTQSLSASRRTQAVCETQDKSTPAAHLKTTGRQGQSDLPARTPSRHSASPLRGPLRNRASQHTSNAVGEKDSRVRSLEESWKLSLSAPEHLHELIQKLDKVRSAPTTAAHPMQETYNDQAIGNGPTSPRSPTSPMTPRSKASQAPSKQRVKIIGVPGEAELTVMFDQLDSHRTGFISAAEVRQYADILNNEKDFGFQAEDAERLVLFLAGSKTAADNVSISKPQFVTGITRLARVLRSLSKRNFTLKHMKVVLLTAFNTFDTNNDGEISKEEFGAAVEQMGLNLSTDEIQVMHSFLVASKESGLRKDGIAKEPDFMQKWSAVLSDAAENMSKKKGVQAIMQTACRVGDAFNEPGDIFQKVQKAMHTASEEVEEIGEALELAVEAASMSIAVNYIGQEVQEALEAHTIQNLDISAIAPFILFVGLGVLNTAESLNGIVPQEMTEAEAILYARVFKQYGFNQADFKKILRAPGCTWCTAEAGEVVSTANDTSLKIILKGRAEVCGTGAKLSAGTSIGESEFLKRRRIWGDSEIKATETLTYISWDIESLNQSLRFDSEVSDCMTRLVIDTMAANLQTLMHVTEKNKATESKQETPEQLLEEAGLVVIEQGESMEGLFKNYSDEDTVDASQACNMLQKAGRFMNLHFEAKDCLILLGSKETISIASMKQLVTTAETCKNLLTNIRGSHLMKILKKGQLNQQDVQELLPNLCDRIGICPSEAHTNRMFAFIGVMDGGVVSIDHFYKKFTQLAAVVDCMVGLGLSMEQFLTVLHKAFQQFDENGDGAISVQELFGVMGQFDFSLSSEQVLTLHEYLDINKDGMIETSGVGEGACWSSELERSMKNQVERKGFAEFGYIMEKVKRVLDGEGDLKTKAEKALDTMWEGAEAFVDVASCTSDVVGILAAVSALWQQASGVTSLEDVSEMDMAPLLIFMGISTVQMLHNVTASQDCSMTHSEALLYAKVFEHEGFTIPDFKKLMKYGHANWENYATGAIIGDAAEATPRLRTVVQGACKNLGGKGAEASGDIIGCEEFLEVAESTAKRVATKPTTTVSWDMQKLSSYLDSNIHLKNKVQGMVTSALAEKLLNQHCK